MKRALLAAVLGISTLAPTICAHAQGQIFLDNYSTYVVGPYPVVTYGAGSGGSVGAWIPSGFTVGFYYSTTPATFNDPSGTAVPGGSFVLGTGANSTVQLGNVFPGFYSAPGFCSLPVPAGSTIYVVVVAYNGPNYASSTVRGHSSVFTMTTAAAPPVPGMGNVASGFSVYPVTSAPIIVENPISKSVLQSNPFTVTIACLGASPLGYQWRLNGTNIPAATSTNYTVGSASLADAGNYDVVVTNSYGSSTSAVAVVQVLPPGAPSIRINNQLAAGTVYSAAPAGVTISNSFPGGFVFYTLDGSTPTTGSTFYNAPFNLNSSATIRALALSADFSQSGAAPPVNLVVIPTYALSTSVLGSGSISLNPPTGPYLSNTVVMVSANAAANWAFDHWSGDLSGSLNPTSIVMNGPRSVQAVFTQTAYPLTLSTPGGGSVTANGQTIAPATYYPTGSVVSLAATPASGWSFVRWQGTTNSTSNPLNITITQSNNIQAVFATVVGTNIAGNGTVVFSPTNPVVFGTTVTATAYPAVGHYFVTWSQAASGTNNPTTFLVASATPTVGALFAASPAPTILAQPTNTSVVLGNSTSLSVLASGAEPLTYQWRKGATNLPSRTNAALAFPSAQAADAGNYSVVVFNTYGSSITSSVATLTVLLPPTIATNPASQWVLLGSNASFSVTATGTAPLSYQWRKNGGPLGAPSLPTYGLTAVSSNDNGNFDVVVSNPYGSATSAVATLTIVYPPTITNQPLDQVAAINTAPAFTVAAEGTAPFSYQWHTLSGPILDATNATLVLSSVQTNQAGAYWAVVANPYAVATSAVAQLTVYIPATITSDPQSLLAAAGDTATFSVGAYGYPALSYQWYKDNVPITNATASSLVISNVWTNHLAIYQAIVWNTYSAATSSPAWLIMRPSLVTPYTGVVALWGYDAVLSVSAVGSGNLGYQWLREGVEIIGATNQTLTIPTVQFTDQGLYSVVVCSEWGCVTNAPAQLVVNPANTSLGLYAGITIEGSPGYTYQIQYTTDLANTNSWQTLTNYTLLQPVELWIDTSVEARSLPKRFYRVQGN